jgi:mRNA-degrading endonuclease RelE of RelBE toxin-antitoxin system
VAQNVQFPADACGINDPARSEILQVLGRVADSISCVPRESAFWQSMQSSLMQIDVSGYRIVYRIEPDPARVRVIEVQEIPH